MLGFVQSSRQFYLEGLEVTAKLIEDVNAVLKRCGLPPAQEWVGKRFLYESTLRGYEEGQTEVRYPALLISIVTGVNAFVHEPYSVFEEQLQIEFSVAATLFGLHRIRQLVLNIADGIPTFTLEYDVLVEGRKPWKTDIGGEEGTLTFLD